LYSAKVLVRTRQRGSRQKTDSALQTLNVSLPAITSQIDDNGLSRQSDKINELVPCTSKYVSK